MRIKWRCIRLVIGVMVLIRIHVAGAMILNPTVQAVDTSHAGMAQITLTNTSTETMPIEVTLRRILFQESGEFTAVDDSDPPFLVFPPAVVLKPGQSQVFRLQWLGQKALLRSESYFVRFTQLQLKPRIQTQSHLSGISVQIHYNALVHFFAEKLHPLVSLTIHAPGVAIVTNHGTRYAYLSQFQFVPSSGASHPLEHLAKKTGERFLPPGCKIKLLVPSNISSGQYVGMLR